MERWVGMRAEGHPMENKRKTGTSVGRDSSRGALTYVSSSESIQTGITSAGRMDEGKALGEFDYS